MVLILFILPASQRIINSAKGYEQWSEMATCCGPGRKAFGALKFESPDSAKCQRKGIKKRNKPQPLYVTLPHAMKDILN